MTASDGGVTNFTYDSDSLLLETITEPGGAKLLSSTKRTATSPRSPTPTTTSRNLTYDGNGRLTGQTWGPLNEDGSGEIDETYTYNAGGVLAEVDDDGDSTYQIDATAGQGLDADDLLDADEGVATVEDDLGNTTTYAMDTDGRLLKETSPDGTSADLAARWARPGRHLHRQPRQRHDVHL